jgi:hypothetical protein
MEAELNLTAQEDAWSEDEYDIFDQAEQERWRMALSMAPDEVGETKDLSDETLERDEREWKCWCRYVCR